MEPGLRTAIRSTSCVKRGSPYTMEATLPLTMYGTPRLLNPRVKRRNKLASGIEERLTNGTSNLIFRPVRMTSAQGGGFQLARGHIQSPCSVELLGRSHSPYDRVDFVIHAKMCAVVLHSPIACKTSLPYSATQGSRC